MGQTLYREVENRGGESYIKKYTVSKIGNKYFYLLEDERLHINKETLRHEDKVYSQFSFILYLSEQEILDRRELAELYRFIYNYFRYGTRTDCTLTQLREIKSILEIR